MRTTKRKKRWQKRGSALALIVSVLMIFLVMGNGLVNLALQSRLAAARIVSEIGARSAADAGLTKALFEMNETLKVKPWDDSELPEATGQMLLNCDGTLSYMVGKDEDAYTIESTGYFGHMEKTVNSILRLRGPFEYAIFADGSIDLKAGTTVDWYNYDEDGENLQVGTNSIEPACISLKNSTTIRGDVVVGVGGNPDVVIDGQWATITGRTYAAKQNYKLPAITAPEWLVSLPSGGTIGTIENYTEIGSSGKYDEIDLKNSKEIEITGDVTLYIVGDVILGNSAQIVMDDDDDASLIMYIGGDLEAKNGSAFNNETQDPKRLKIYGLNSCTNLRFKNSTDFHGAIYAPNADVIFDNSAEAFGSVVARSFEQKNSATFHYDASLRDVSENDEAVCFAISRWQEQ